MGGGRWSIFLVFGAKNPRVEGARRAGERETRKREQGSEKSQSVPAPGHENWDLEMDQERGLGGECRIRISSGHAPARLAQSLCPESDGMRFRRKITLNQETRHGRCHECDSHHSQRNQNERRKMEQRLKGPARGGK